MEWHILAYHLEIFASAKIFADFRGITKWNKTMLGKTFFETNIHLPGDIKISIDYHPAIDEIAFFVWTEDLGKLQEKLVKLNSEGIFTETLKFKCFHTPCMEHYVLSAKRFNSLLLSWLGAEKLEEMLLKADKENSEVWTQFCNFIQ